MAKLSRLEGSKFHVNILCRSSKADSFFFSSHFGTKKWIASAAGILGDSFLQKKATITLRFAVFLYLYLFCFLFHQKNVISKFL